MGARAGSSAARTGTGSRPRTARTGNGPDITRHSTGSRPPMGRPAASSGPCWVTPGAVDTGTGPRPRTTLTSTGPNITRHTTGPRPHLPHPTSTRTRPRRITPDTVRTATATATATATGTGTGTGTGPRPRTARTGNGPGIARSGVISGRRLFCSEPADPAPVGRRTLRAGAARRSLPWCASCVDAGVRPPGGARLSGRGRSAGLLVLGAPDAARHQGCGQYGGSRQAVGARPVPGPAASTPRH
ncbi:hypothetical protein SNL152K_8011 [Streptomyces sp. NL15-2K]|nr:hypothetical protein SNL152K_8011 [Streptomyces sp. NL15-2K]